MCWFRIAFGVALLVVAGCGFRPLYGERADSVRDRLAAIAINQIRDRVAHEDRIGYEVYNQLRDNLNPRGVPATPLYSLAVQLTIDITPLIMAGSNTITYTVRKGKKRRLELRIHTPKTTAQK